MPILRSKPQPDDDGYYPAGPSAAAAADQTITLQIAGDVVMVTRVDGRLYAFSAACPHAAGDLRKGSLHRGRIDCPDHNYRFDICSGHVLWPPDEFYRLKRYDVIEVDGSIKVRPAAPGAR